MKIGSRAGFTRLFVALFMSSANLGDAARIRVAHSPTAIGFTTKYGGSLTPEGIASGVLTLPRWVFDRDARRPQAESMSLGPVGPWRGDSTFVDPVDPDRFELRYGYDRRPRVAVGSFEGPKGIWIDDIAHGNADSRSVVATYFIHSYAGLASSLRGGLPPSARARERPHDQPDPPIRWISPSSIAWMSAIDTLTFTQRADSVFHVTLRERVR